MCLIYAPVIGTEHPLLCLLARARIKPGLGSVAVPSDTFLSSDGGGDLVCSLLKVLLQEKARAILNRGVVNPPHKKRGVVCISTQTAQIIKTLRVWTVTDPLQRNRKPLEDICFRWRRFSSTTTRRAAPLARSDARTGDFLASHVRDELIHQWGGR